MAHLSVPSLAYLAAPALPFAPPVASQCQSVPVLPPPVPPPSNPTSSRPSRLSSLPDTRLSAGSTVSARRHKVVFDLVRRHPPILPPLRTPPSDSLRVALISICSTWRSTTSLWGVDRWRSLSSGRPAMSEALSRSVSHSRDVLAHIADHPEPRPFGLTPCSFASGCVLLYRFAC